MEPQGGLRRREPRNHVRFAVKQELANFTISNQFEAGGGRGAKRYANLGGINAD